MGRNYYCEYCDKRLKDDVQIRKKHIDGLQHQKARKEHYAKYKSPKEILSEEMTKKPCPWYQNGSCQYGLSCHNSHYTLEQLGQLQQQAYQMDYNEWLRQQPKQYNQQLIDTFMARRDQSQCVQNFERLRELWKYPEGLLRNTENVPPSLQPLNPALIPLELDQWG